MQARRLNVLQTDQSQPASDRGARILLFDEIPPHEGLLARLKDIKGVMDVTLMMSQDAIIEELRRSAGTLLLIATVSFANFTRNIELLCEVTRLNAEECYTRIGCLYLLADPHGEIRIEEYLNHGAQVLDRRCPDDVVRGSAKQIVWRLRATKEHLVVLRFVQGPETLRIFICGPLGQTDMELGGAMLDLVEYVGNTPQGLTLRSIATEIGRSKASIVEYRRRLIDRFNELKDSVGVLVPGDKVFSLTKVGMTWIFRLRARVSKK